MTPALVAALRQRMLTFALLPLGVLLVIVGSALAWGKRPLVGFAIGSIGLVLLVVGAVVVRTRMIQPFLDADGDPDLEETR